jgi:hypothetical protein
MYGVTTRMNLTWQGLGWRAEGEQVKSCLPEAEGQPENPRAWRPLQVHSVDGF